MAKDQAILSHINYEEIIDLVGLQHPSTGAAGWWTSNK